MKFCNKSEGSYMFKKSKMANSQPSQFAGIKEILRYLYHPMGFNLVWCLYLIELWEG